MISATVKGGGVAPRTGLWRPLRTSAGHDGRFLRQRIFTVGGVVVLYCIAARLGEVTAVPPTNVCALWPPSGMALAVILLWGRGMWPGIRLGELIGSTWAFFDPSSSASIAASVGSGLAMAIGATVQPLLGAMATRRLIGQRSSLEHAAYVFTFAAVAPAMCMIGATIGVAALGMRGIVPWDAYGLTWLTWWLGDTVGVLLVTPVMLAWRQETPIRLSRGSVFEGLTFLVLLVSVIGAVFGGIVPVPYADYPLEILLLPPLAWLALRSNPQAAGIVALAVALTAVGATASGVGPFARGALHQSVLLAQVFVGLVAVTVHVMVAVVGERRRAERALIEARAGLEKRVVERTAELTCANRTLQAEVAERQRAESALLASEERFRALAANATDLVVIVDPDARIRYVSPSVERILGYRPEQIIGAKAFDYLHPDDTAALQDLFVQAVDQPGINPAAEFRARRADGSWMWFESVANNLLADPVMMGIVANARDVTARKRAEDELQRSHAQLRALSARLQSVREEASARIAREIHDELGQALTALKMDLAWLQRRVERSTAAVRNKIAAMTQLVDATVQSVRRISTELRPGVLDDLGLTAAIEWQAREFQARTGIECTFTGAEDLLVDRDRATVLFRVLQESLTNVTRHADATWVGVVLIAARSHILLTVRDNGKGITEQQVAARSSLGLLGMRERVHAFGGDVTVRGAPGHGTEISVCVPLEPSPSDAPVPATRPSDETPPGATPSNGVERGA